MQHTPLLRITSLATTLILFASLLSATAPAQSGFTITPVVTRGTKVSESGKERFFKNYNGYLSGFRALNNQGDVIVSSSVGGNCSFGTYLISKEKITPLADYFCTPSPLGQFQALENSSLNDSGKAVLVGRTATANYSIQSIFFYEDGQLKKIISEGDLTPVNTIFKSTLSGANAAGPMVNSAGEVAFSALTEELNGQRQDAIFVYANGVIRKVVATGDASPVLGSFNNLFNVPQSARINDKGEVLFYGSSVSDDKQSESYGFFLSTAEGFKKVIATADPLPTGGYFHSLSCIPDFNNRSEVVFTAGTGGHPDYPAGIFLWSEGGLSTIAQTGDPTPAGGQFALQSIRRYDTPRINNNGAIAFGAPLTGGVAPEAIFLASKKAMLKVVAVGDRLPSGEKITFLGQFALNDLGQIAFLVYSNKSKPLGIFIATPATPETGRIEFLQNNGVYELRVNGKDFINNDSVIEINGVPLDSLMYPEEARVSGGNTRQIISRDARLEQLLQSGLPAQITVFNTLTKRRSPVKEFSR